MENISRKNNSLDDMPTRKSLDSLDWYKILSDIGIKNKIKFYNDIVVEKRPPYDISNDPKVLDGWHLALNDVEIFPNKFIDVYHTDTKENKGTFGRIFIHEKQ